MKLYGLLTSFCLEIAILFWIYAAGKTWIRSVLQQFIPSNTAINFVILGIIFSLLGVGIIPIYNELKKNGKNE